MKRILLVGILALGAFLAYRLLFDVPTTFDVNGRIRGFSDDGFTIFIEHENIPNLMPAMSMPFTLRDTTQTRGLNLHDAIRFTLYVSRGNSWIDDLRRIPDSKVAAYPAGSLPPPGDPSAHPILAQGDTLPDLSLIDQNGSTFSLHDFQGRPLILTFIYTRCPLPDYCPRLSLHFQALQTSLSENTDNQTQLLSISFDPENDTPAVLKDYAARYTDQTDNWTFATGNVDQVTAVTSAFGLSYSAGPNQSFDHNLITALIAPDGRVVRIWNGRTWTPDDVLSTMSLEGLL